MALPIANILSKVTLSQILRQDLMSVCIANKILAIYIPVSDIAAWVDISSGRPGIFNRCG